MVAAMMKPGDVAVVISNTGTTRSIIEVARIARESGATVIGSDRLGFAAGQRIATCLIVETLDNTNIYTPTISRIAALAVVDILSTAVAMRRDPAHQQLRSLP